MRCEKCGFDFDSSLERCPKCGASIEFSGNTMFYRQVKTTHARFFSTCFSGVFRKHPAGTAGKMFVAGTPETTPTTDKMFSVWQKPWLYSRFLIAGIIFTIAFFFISPLVAGSFGSIIFPFAVLMFVWEMNIPRDISFPKVIVYFAFGGLLSIGISLIIYAFFDDVWDPLAAFVEEPAKLLITILFVHIAKPKYGFGGMLIGASVGAGFAVFETVMYVLGQETLGDLLFVFALRSFLSIGGHVTWAAIVGAAVALGRKGKTKGAGYLAYPLFWVAFVSVMAMHFLWNGGLEAVFYEAEEYLLFIQIVLCIIAVIVLFVYMNICLKQVVRAYDDARSEVLNKAPYAVAAAGSSASVPQSASAIDSFIPSSMATPGAVSSPESEIKVDSSVNNPEPVSQVVAEPVAEQTKPKTYTVKCEFLGVEKSIDKIINIGRDSSFCDIVFPSDTAGVSRKHCAVMASPEGIVYVMDLGSSNGTFLAGGRRISPNEWVPVDDSFYTATEKYSFTIQ